MRTYLIFVLILFCFEAFACGTARNRINAFFNSRSEAFHKAKRDAGILKNQHPTRVDHVPMTDKNHHPMFDENHNMIMTREYHFRTGKGKEIIIQEHTAAHPGSIKEAGGLPHFNIRPADDPRHGIVPGTASHYNIGAQ
jgi:hypothetical protein